MKSLGPASFIFFAAAIGFMTRKWPPDASKTLSQNAARTSASAWYYGVIMLIFLAALSEFIYAWFIPALNLPLAFAVVFGVGALAQTVAALIPETVGTNVTIHRMAAGIMYFATIPLVEILALCLSGPAVGKTLILAAFAVITGLIVVTLAYKPIQRHAMALQISHLSALAAALMIATYLR